MNLLLDSRLTTQVLLSLNAQEEAIERNVLLDTSEQNLREQYTPNLKKITL